MPTKILFIDDEPEFINPQIYALEDAGFQVIVKSDADSALETLRRMKFDLIVLDLIMPYQSSSYHDDQDYSHTATGIKVHQAIREELMLTDVPIIFLSVARDQTLHRSLRQIESKYGHSLRFLVKPALSSDVVMEVQKALEEARR